jgi:hypothetical protein
VHSATTQPGSVQAIFVLVLILVGLAVAYWRTTVRLLLIVVISLAVLSVILTAVGVADAIRELHYLLG